VTKDELAAYAHAMRVDAQQRWHAAIATTLEELQRDANSIEGAIGEVSMQEAADAFATRLIAMANTFKVDGAEK